MNSKFNSAMTDEDKKKANKIYKKCCSKSAERNLVIGLLNNPPLLVSYKISRFDFVDFVYHIAFLCIEQLYVSGATDINIFTIEDFLRNYPAQYEKFQKLQGFEILEKGSDTSEDCNMDYNYNLLKKMSLLRFLAYQGFDISKYYSDDAGDKLKATQQANIDSSSLLDISNNFRGKLLSVTEEYTLSESRDFKKAGVGGLEQKEKWKNETAWGLGYSSRFLTTALHGIRQRRYVIKSAGSGTGKTRTAIADICFAFCPRYYDKKEDKWKVNPNGTHNACLYIGTEMELLEEIDPILWAYIADVPEEHIEYNLYEEGEEERVEEAIKILAEEANIYLAYLPDYDLNALESVIEKHKINYGVDYVFFDYIHTTAELTSEYSTTIKGHMTIREDQVLSNLSTKIKELTRKYNISFDTCTQTTGDLKDTNNRDAGVVRGAKSIVDKCDAAMIATVPTASELKLLKPIIEAGFGKKVPNLCYSLYKNRGGKLNRIKIWMYINYDTMRTQDLFVTDYEYQKIDIPKTYIETIDDQRMVTEIKVASKDYEEEEVELMENPVGTNNGVVVLQELEPEMEALVNAHVSYDLLDLPSAEEALGIPSIDDMEDPMIEDIRRSMERYGLGPDGQVINEVKEIEKPVEIDIDNDCY